MFVLTRSITILDRHTGLARLEIDASLLAALGAAAGIRIVMISIIHFNMYPFEIPDVLKLKSGFALLPPKVSTALNNKTSNL
jgi:hypothetical protein